MNIKDYKGYWNIRTDFVDWVGPNDQVWHCWQWTGASNVNHGGNRYGVVSYKTKSMGIHRASYLEFVGEIEVGNVVHHKCENTLCWNPDHLDQVTQQSNLLESNTPAKRNSQKTHCPSGHIYDETNTYLKKVKNRVIRECRNCARIRMNKKRATS